jgi:hypothetical protein
LPSAINVERHSSPSCISSCFFVSRSATKHTGKYSDAREKGQPVNREYYITISFAVCTLHQILEKGKAIPVTGRGDP